MIAFPKNSYIKDMFPTICNPNLMYLVPSSYIIFVSFYVYTTCYIGALLLNSNK